MANYADQSDLEFRLPSVTLAQLSDDVGGETINSATITRSIVDAMSTVDSFCRGKQEVPFDPVPDNVRRWTVDLAVVNLYARRPDLLLPPAIKDKYDLTVTELKAVRDNKILINDPDSAGNTGNYYKINLSAPQAIFKTTVDKNGRLDRFFAPHDGLDSV